MLQAKVPLEEHLLNKDFQEEIFELGVLEKFQKSLRQGSFSFSLIFNEKEKNILDSYRFLTLKPKIFLLNGERNDIDSEMFEKLKGKNFMTINLVKEDQLSGSDREEKINNLIKECYNSLGYITFFTVNSEETRGWKTKKGTKVPETGGIVHTDFEKGFIKAEVINWKDFVETGGFSEARKKGLIRTEGKNYVVQDGDIIQIKFK